MTAVWLALLSAVLALIGTAFGAWLARNRDIEKARKDLITAAYAKLLDASSLAAGPRAARLTGKRNIGAALEPEEEKFLDDIQAKFASAHSNIAIYGSKEVIAALSHFYDHAVEGMSPAATQAYVALITAMRRETDAEDYGSFDEHVDNILVNGPLRRGAAMMAAAAEAAKAKQAPPTHFGISYSFHNGPQAEAPAKE